MRGGHEERRKRPRTNDIGKAVAVGSAEGFGTTLQHQCQPFGLRLPGAHKAMMLRHHPLSPTIRHWWVGWEDGQRTGGEDSSSCPFRLSTALEDPAGYADLGNK